jgi:hypothetical protein
MGQGTYGTLALLVMASLVPSPAQAAGGDSATQPLALIAPLLPEARIGQVANREVIKTWTDLEIEAQVFDMDPAATKNAVWEVRSADGKRLIRSVPMPWDLHSGADKVSGITGSFHLSDTDCRALAAEGDGTFLAAWRIDGERRSNVIKITIDSKHELKDEPLVRVCVGEPPAPGMQPTLAVTYIRRADSDPEIPSYYLVLSNWTIDGRPVQRQGPLSINRVEQLQVGKASSFILSPSVSGTTLDPKKPHTISTDVQKSESEPVNIQPGTPLGDLWDQETGSPVATPPAP